MSVTMVLTLYSGIYMHLVSDWRIVESVHLCYRFFNLGASHQQPVIQSSYCGQSEITLTSPRILGTSNLNFPKTGLTSILISSNFLFSLNKVLKFCFTRKKIKTISLTKTNLTRIPSHHKFQVAYLQLNSNILL